LLCALGYGLYARKAFDRPVRNGLSRLLNLEVFVGWGENIELGIAVNRSNGYRMVVPNARDARCAIPKVFITRV